MEQLLHFTWKHKIFPLEGLKTTTGDTVEVIDTGLSNHHAGPDFFNAKLKINAKTENTGVIEIKYNTQEDIDYVLDVLPKLVEKVRQMSPVWNNR